jgi:hypothetical protein
MNDDTHNTERNERVIIDDKQIVHSQKRNSMQKVVSASRFKPHKRNCV